MGGDSYFPEDIIREILLRLRVRSLLRFMALSKHWFSLITSSDFISNHYQHPSNPKLCVRRTIRPSHSISVFRDGTERVEDRNIPLVNDMDIYGVKIVGSSNGLLCLCTRGRKSCYILWNLATRQYRKLPSHKGIGYSKDQWFGFHHGVNDYKLLQIVSNSSKDQPEAEVFALSTDSWRKVEDTVPPYDYSISNPVVLKGVWYHLAAYHERPFIMRFDMGDETFLKLETAPPPCNDYMDEYIDNEVELMVYEELPAICRYHFDYAYDGVVFDKSAFQFDIWVMKDEYWTKVLTCSGNFLDRAPPFGFCVDEESIILELFRRDDLCLFNLWTKQSKMLVIDAALRLGPAHNYVESMVSVYPTN